TERLEQSLNSRFLRPAPCRPLITRSPSSRFLLLGGGGGPKIPHDRNNEYRVVVLCPVCAAPRLCAAGDCPAAEAAADAAGGGFSRGD
ncbi:MAG: hypothetical protein LBH70_08345, partial [Spirochaetaceae bacterium]|nr:hypothetical protein [Spirochaetaceae bacterium]